MKRKIGQAILEAVLGIAFVMPLLLILFDLAITYLAVQKNEELCRNAARAAAAGPPEQASVRARVVLAGSKCGAGFVSGFTVLEPVLAKIDSRPQRRKDPFSDKIVIPGGPITGEITVTTEVDVNPVLLHLIYGAKPPIKFQARVTTPITYISPPSTTDACSSY